MKKRNLISLMLGLFINIFALTACDSDDNYEKEENYEVASIQLDKEYLSLYEGEGEFVTATVKPSNAANKNLLWFSRSPNVASVTNGYVVAISKGETTITITTEDGQVQESLPVTVRSPRDDIKAVFFFRPHTSPETTFDEFGFWIDNKTGETVTVTSISVTNENTKAPVPIDSFYFIDWWYDVFLKEPVKVPTKLSVVVTFVFHGKEYSCDKFYVE